MQFKREIGVWAESKERSCHCFGHRNRKIKRKAQAALETERQKVSFAVAVLDIVTTTDPLRDETLIDMQLINIARFYGRFFKLYKKVHYSTLLIWALPPFLFPSNPFYYYPCIHDCYVNIKRKSYIRRKMIIKYCTRMNGSNVKLEIFITLCYDKVTEGQLWGISIISSAHWNICML